MAVKRPPREGGIYKTLTVGGREFVIRYGYYSADDRMLEDPMPILPDFSVNPEYSVCGKPFVTRIQDACEYYSTLEGTYGDGWCADCKYYRDAKEEIALCENEKRFKVISFETSTEEIKEA